MRELNVELPLRSYPILLGGTAEWLPVLAEKIAGRKCLLVTDENVCKAGHPEQLLAALNSCNDVECTLCVLPAGEEHKTLGTVEQICRSAVTAGLDRKSVMIAFSGGVTGDLTGFAAAIYMRGIDFIQLPSTLLAAVDSSVGGKTGADLPDGKNLVGAFHQPLMVALDMQTLTTLPESEWRNGLAEIVKYGVIMAPEFFVLLENNLAKLNSFDPDFYAEIIHRSCQCKAEVVAGDEREQGRRAILNYGHTVGHAVEKLSNFALPHGRAVAIGMAAAARLAVKMQLLDPAAEVRQNQLLAALDLPVCLPENSCVKSIVEAMKSDKKNSNGKITMVLPQAIGNVIIRRDIDEELLTESLQELL